MLARHWVFLPTVQGLPLVMPQALSRASHAPELQTKAPAAWVQFPSSLGLVCPGSLATGAPLAARGLQVRVEMLHQLLAPQSASTSQPVGVAPHLPVALHCPVRQSCAALAAVQGPWPSGKPHLPSVLKQSAARHCASLPVTHALPFLMPQRASVVSHAPVRHVSAAASCVQVPSSLGVV